jgi:hypothetical protein
MKNNTKSAKTTTAEVTPEDVQAAFSNHAPSVSVKTTSVQKYEDQHFAIRANSKVGYVQIISFTEAAKKFLEENEVQMLEMRELGEAPDPNVDAEGSRIWGNAYLARGKRKTPYGLSNYEFEMSKLSPAMVKVTFQNLLTCVLANRENL